MSTVKFPVRALNSAVGHEDKYESTRTHCDAFSQRTRGPPTSCLLGSCLCIWSNISIAMCCFSKIFVKRDIAISHFQARVWQCLPRTKLPAKAFQSSFRLLQPVRSSSSFCLCFCVFFFFNDTHQVVAFLCCALCSFQAVETSFGCSTSRACRVLLVGRFGLALSGVLQRSFKSLKKR